MSENPYSAPASESLERSPGQARRRLVPVAVALLVVTIVWIFLLLFGIAYFFLVAGSPDHDAENRRVYYSYMLYMAVSALYSLLLATGAQHARPRVLCLGRRDQHPGNDSVAWPVLCGCHSNRHLGLDCAAQSGRQSVISQAVMAVIRHLSLGLFF